MRKTSIAFFALFLCSILGAQETPSKFSLYGFIRNFYAFDTRESKAGTEDFFYYLPLDEKNSGAEDLNDQSSFRFAALTSRVGLNATGYEFNGLKMGAKVEADFYSGVSGVTGTAQMRLRQAFVTFGKESWTIKAGQAWHPMAADMPDVFSLNGGAPFGPFSRTPQVTLDYKLGGGLSLTAAAIWQMQYTSAGPSGASADYIKYSKVPEMYVGLNMQNDKFLFRAGLDVLSISPRHDNGSKKVSDRITTLTPFFYGQLKEGKFAAKFKTTYAQAGEHMNLNGGYAVSKVLEDDSWEYTPTRNSSTWLSLSYGKKVQGILFGGYVKNFGTADEILGSDGSYAPASNLYFSKNSFSNLNQMWRVTPTVIWNLGKLALGLEYEVTSVQYGDYKTVSGTKMIGSKGLATDNLHWITNNRVQALVKFTF